MQHIFCAHYQISEDDITPEIIFKGARRSRRLAALSRFKSTRDRPKGSHGPSWPATRRYGLRLLAFDNLHMLARSIEHRVEEVGVLTEGFKLFAMEHEIPVLLIAQPRKLDAGKVMTPWDLKDSVDIYSDADQVVILHRQTVGATRRPSWLRDFAMSLPLLPAQRGTVRHGQARRIG